MSIDLIDNREHLVASPIISVVIPTLNRCEDLNAAIRSLQNQSESRFEVIVVDNGPSSDRTAMVMSKLLAEDSRIVYVRTDQKGDVIARNIGCKLAVAPIILTTDDDWEVTHEDTLKYIVDSFESDSRIGVIGIGQQDDALDRKQKWHKRTLYPILRLWHRTGKISRWGRVSTRFYYLPYGQAHEVDHVKGACMAFRSDVAKSHAYFPTFYILEGMGYRAETELCRRYARDGYKIVYSTIVTGLHKATPRPKSLQSRSRDVKSVRQWARNNTLFTCRNYWSRKSAWCFMVYDVMVGNFNQPGILRVLVSIKYFLQIPLLLSSVRGKLEGYTAYMKRYHDMTVTT